MTHTAKSLAPVTTQIEFHPIRWLLRLDAAYREARKLKNAEDQRLDDMGITRKEADAVFYSRFGQNRWYSR